MNPDLFLKPLRLGRQTFPGIWRVMMPAGFMQLRFPDEREANCMNCPKSCYEDWRPDYRCCTYHPRISNFLLGFACRTPEGARAVDELLQRGMVLPEGMHSSPRQWLDFVDDEHHDVFGKSQKVLCPMLDPASGFCRVHAFRNSVCSTYFCNKDQGHAGELFWSQIQTLGTQLEMRLAQWALREVGFDVEASLRALDDLAPNLRQASSSQGWHPDALKKIWGPAWGQEKEILLACADAIVKHQDELWSIAQQQTIIEPHQFDSALLQEVPEEQQDILDEDEDAWEEVVDLSALWDDCLTAHTALWADPQGRFILSPNVSFVPNPRQSTEELYYRDKDFFIEYRFNNPQRSLYFRLTATTRQKTLLESFMKARTIMEMEAEVQDFLKEMAHRKVLRAVP
jgi:Fe-S-cluster containining protein